MERRRYVRSNYAEVVGTVKPILFDAGETAFAGNGLGVLADAVSCIVTEERNGAFELEMEYPVNGIHYGELALRRLILAEPNAAAVAQPFRIYKIARPMGGVVAVSASHISYDLSGVPVSPFTATTAAEAFAGFSSHAIIENPFTFTSELATQGNFTVTVPASIRSLLGGTEGSIIDVYGGEYEFNRFNVVLRAARGQNRGVSIRYGKNLTSLEQDENCESVYTGVLGYWSGESGPLVVGEIAYAPGTYAVQRILVVDFTQDYETQPTSAQLTASAASYVSRNGVGVPSVSLSVSFVQLGQSAEYADIEPLEQVNLCDTVNVEFPALGVSATAKCVKTVYNVLTGRLDSVDIGEARGNIASTIAEQQQAIKDTPQQVLSEVGRITSMITGNTGGYVVLNIPDGETYPRELLIMDTPSKATAMNVWRWNLGGLGHSKNGVNGPYTTAITQDGQIVADFITAGTFTATGSFTTTYTDPDTGDTLTTTLSNGRLSFYANGTTAMNAVLMDVDGNKYCRLDLYMNGQPLLNACGDGTLFLYEIGQTGELQLRVRILSGGIAGTPFAGVPGFYLHDENGNVSSFHIGKNADGAEASFLAADNITASDSLAIPGTGSIWINDGETGGGYGYQGWQFAPITGADGKHYMVIAHPF